MNILALIGGIVIVAIALGAFVALVAEFSQLFLCVVQSIKKRLARTQHNPTEKIEGRQ